MDWTVNTPGCRLVFVRLTAQTAEIQTAAVEIRTLTVSGKQVTQAVFRQLREQPLVTEAGEFTGLPWGTVNYHPDRCADDGEHRHVVWQEGAELRRSKVYRPHFSRYWPESADDWLQMVYCINNHARPEWASEHYRSDGVIVCAIQFRGLPITARVPDDYAEYVNLPRRAYPVFHGDPAPGEPSWLPWQGEQVTGRHDCFADCCAAARHKLDSLIRTEVSEEIDRRSRYQDRWSEIDTGLPQLFIAV